MVKGSVKELTGLLEQYPDMRDILLIMFEVDEEQCTLHTMFADMCCKPVPLSVVPTPKSVNWNTARLVNPFLLRVQFADGRGAYEIPTSEIRALIDHNQVLKETIHVSKHRKRVCQRLKALREKEGLTQGQLAKRAGIQRVTLNRIENGSQNATLETLEKLAGSLGVDVATLLA